MAVVLNSLQYFELIGLTGTRNKIFGDRSAFTTLTLTGETAEFTSIVADNYQEEIMWATNQGNLATFLVGTIETDKDILVELQDGSEDNRFNAPAGIITVFGGKVVSVMGGDTVAATIGDVDQILVKRNVADGIGDASVTLRLYL